MAKPVVANRRAYFKPTIVYGLIDPASGELRYVGKTIKKLSARLYTHIWHARFSKRKRHVLAWVTSVLATGREPQIVELETVDIGDDWVEAEQFWIGYFSSIGAKLCNLTIGGEGAPGAKKSNEQIDALRRRWSGDEHPTRGKPMHPNAKAALAEAMEKCRADPEWMAWAASRRRAGMSPEMLAAATARLHAPSVRAKAIATRAANPHSEEARERIGAASKATWADKREAIIAAQNAGKGDEWSRKQSESKKAQWRDPVYRKRTSEAHAEKLDAGRVRKIKEMLAAGARNKDIAAMFGVDRSMVSWIKSGKRWAHISL